MLKILLGIMYLHNTLPYGSHDLAYALMKWFLCSVQACSEDLLIISSGLVNEAEQSKKTAVLHHTILVAAWS